MKVYKLVCLSVICAIGSLTSGCTSREDDLKVFFACSMAAKSLDQYEASRKISKKMEAYITENNIEGSARDAMELADEVRNDLNLYELNMQGKMETFLDIFNSSDCMELHEQEEISLY